MASGGGHSSSFGRGGRGAALLQALENSQNSRKPGQSEDEVSTLSNSMPLGRGSLLASLRQIQEAKQVQLPLEPTKQESASCLKPDQGSLGGGLPSLGRGLAAMKELLQRQQQQSQLAQQQSQLSQQPSQLSQQPSQLSLQQSPLAQQQRQTWGRGRLSQQLVKQQDEPPEEPRSPVPDQLTDRLEQTHIEEQIRPETNKYKERTRLPTISKIGTEGTQCDLSANYVRVLCKNVSVYQYFVAFSPVIDNKRLKMKLLSEHKDKFKTVNSFDGNTLYLPYQLPDKETTVTSTRPTDGAIITIVVTFVKAVPPEQCCHLYNVVFRRIMNILEMCQVGRYYYNPHTPASVPQHKLEVWPGYITAIREHEGGLLLLLDASHRVLRTETVYDIMEKSLLTNPNGFREEIIKKVVGCTVLTRYNNKTYKVDDILWSKTPLDLFECKATGGSMSFDEYYRKQHNIVLKNKTQPLLLNKRKPPRGAPADFKLEPEFLCLIPELCYMSGLTDDIRSQFTVMKDLAAHTRVTPAQRQSAMRKFINSVNSNLEAKAQLAVWGLELDSSTISISGRLLPMEKIYMGKREFTAGPQADWSREACRNELISSVSLLNWGIFFTRKDAVRANDFIKHLQSEAKNMGMSCNVPFRRELVNEKIDTLIQELRNSINERVQLVVIINPTNRDDRYSAIKKFCCVEAPVPSQVIISKTISRPDKLRSVVQKIALQINCKLGGELWSLSIPLQKLMVIGIDTYHDATKSKQSIGGFVASMNRTCTRWFSKVCIQRPGQELVQGLQVCLIVALKKYHAENHFLPEKIVIFRDGVGDGQLDILIDHEVKQLQRCFSSFGDYTPNCTTVCVQKRINTRIYGKDKDGSLINPPSGTVVDQTVTRRERYDFFLVSQHVRQGTVSPTHYIVVDDGIDLKPGQMQRLTYKMTHLYYNWPGTVRVPAPCQYAHKLAYLVGESIHKEPAECLSDRLFFL
uniref:Uncharacterized protein n=1 Tax=Lymnaea stagnalis TaxID=6523 RepID=A0A7S6WWR0_LYMST|nr:hypothetical protein [Lymnaea stagnalis]